MLHAACLKYRMQKLHKKNRHLHTIAQLCWAVSSQLKYVLTTGKKLLNSNISSTCPHNMVNFGPLMVRSVYQFGAPQQVSMAFASWLRYCTNVDQWRSTKLWRCFAVSWAVTLYIHFWGLLSPNGILPGAKFTLHSSLVCSYIGSVTAWHFSSGH